MILPKLHLLFLIMSWHVIRSQDLDQATTREHHGTSTRSLPPSKPRRLPRYAIVRTSSCQRNQQCAIVRTNGDQECAIVRTSSYQQYVQKRPEWRVVSYHMITTWVKSHQLSTTHNRYLQFGDDLGEESSSRSKPRSHGGGLRLE